MAGRSIWCRIVGHDWERPVFEDGKRVERCYRCAGVRDHVVPVPTAEERAVRFTQASLDGSTAVTVVVMPRVAEPVPVSDEVRARREEIKARAIARSEAARGRVSRGVH